MRNLLVLILLFTTSCFAADRAELMAQLNDGSFDVRELATDTLSKQLSIDDVETLLKQSKEEKLAEVAYRERKIAYRIFLREVTMWSKPYLLLHGALPAAYSISSCADGTGEPHWVPCLIMAAPGVPQILKWDIVVKIDGEWLKDWQEPPNFERDHLYQLTIHRYKDTTAISDGHSSSSNPDDYDEIIIPVTAADKDHRLVDEVAEDKVIADAWDAYLIAHGWRPKPDPSAAP